MNQRMYCDQNHPGSDAEAERWCRSYHQVQMPGDARPLMASERMKQGYTGNYMSEGKCHAVREDTTYEIPYVRGTTYGDTVCGRKSVNVGSDDFNPEGFEICQRCVQIIESRVDSKCAGSGGRGLDGRFPGDSDRCPVCSRDHVRVTPSGVLASHAHGKGLRSAEP